MDRDFLQDTGSDRTRKNGFRLRESRYGLDIREKFFTVKVLRPWNREAVDAPAPEVFKARLNGVWSNLI